MFAQNRYAKVWKIDNSGNFPKVQISISKRKEDGEYETEFSEWVAFFGKAKEKAENLSENDRIKILSCGVKNWFNKETEKKYYNFMIFDYEDAGMSDTTGVEKRKPATKPEPAVEESEDEELPF
jgi:hypothetical protein